MLANVLTTLAICSVISYRKEEFLSRMERLAKRARKYGMTPPEAREIGSHKEPIYREVETVAGPQLTDEVIGWRLYYDFHVEHDTMRLPGGWTFLGTLEHTGEGNILRLLCDEEKSQELGLASYRQAPPSCDHCQTSRRRKDTYLVLSEAGEVRQVGKSCLQDYLGRDAAKSIGLFESFKGLENEDWETGSGGAFQFDVTSFVAVAKHHIEEFGWVSRSDGGYGYSTADHVLGCLYDCLDRKAEAVAFHKEALEKYGSFAKDAIDWASCLPGDTASNYLQNLQVLSRLGCIEGKHAGFMASLPNAYSRELEKQAMAARRKDTNALAKAAGHFGRVGDKIASTLTKKDREAGRRSLYYNPATNKVVEIADTGKRALKQAGLALEGLTGIPVTVIFRRTTEGEVTRGWNTFLVTRTILKMQTDEGHILTWFKSDIFDNPPEPGDRILLCGGIVDRHGEYNEVPETVLSRCYITQQE